MLVLVQFEVRPSTVSTNTWLLIDPGVVQTRFYLPVLFCPATIKSMVTLQVKIRARLDTAVQGVWIPGGCRAPGILREGWLNPPGLDR